MNIYLFTIKILELNLRHLQLECCITIRLVSFSCIGNGHASLKLRQSARKLNRRAAGVLCSLDINDDTVQYSSSANGAKKRLPQSTSN